jgi:Holliday junction resolvasome RuvABC endonuclease subunit
MSLAKALRSGRVLSIDPSTNSIAFAVMEYDKLLAWGKVQLPKGDFPDKFRVINATIPLLIKQHKPTHFVVEQSIYIQNPNTSRSLAYINGCIFSAAVRAGHKKVSDIVPITWKAGIGYKRVSAGEKRIWADTMTTREVTKKAEFERKERVKRIVDAEIPGHGCVDGDIIDAIGIGLWAVKNVL